jgi:uncharacterized repeat protein (TIGR03803 family)
LFWRHQTTLTSSPTYGRERAILVASALLTLAGCGGGGGGSFVPPPPPPTVTAQILYSFGGTSTDAMGPAGVLIQGSDGNVYGTTDRGGLVAGCSNGAATTNPYYVGCGTVFKITPTGEETVLHLFAAAPADGANPEFVIQGKDGNFYGTTATGGANNLGTVFKLTPEGVETILYSFAGGSDGAGAQGLVQGSDGNFYGTTAGGGVNNSGTVFRLIPGGVETILYSFSGTSYAGPDGANPIGQLVQGSDGNFYGVTALGGLPSPVVNNTTTCGTVFKVTPEGVETILHRFSGPDGQGPNGLIQGSNGNFYGTTDGANTTFGTVFKITPEGAETTLYTFNPAVDGDGAIPAAGLTQGSDGNFYGTTSGGGKNEGGTMFQLTPAGVETVLYSFPNFPKSTYPDPSPDTNLIQGSDGNLYGATYSGGAYDEGYFFKLVLSSH